MTEKNKNLLVRAVTAILGLPVVLYLLFKGGYWTAGLLAAASAICAGEYYVITQKRLSPIAFVGALCAATLPLFPVLRPGDGWFWAFWTVGLFFLIAWGFTLLEGRIDEAPSRMAHLLAGLLYAGIGFSALSAVRQAEHGAQWVLCALIITWLNDTFAYFFGRLIGRHKLYPEVSPNKTWEGFAGGMLGSVGGMFVARQLVFPELSALDCVLVGALGGVLGPMGDLVESMIKRAYGVKDSGVIIPGHGGLLDRVDALLFNAPMVFLYVRWVHGSA